MFCQICVWLILKGKYCCCCHLNIGVFHAIMVMSFIAEGVPRQRMLRQEIEMFENIEAEVKSVAAMEIF